MRIGIMALAALVLAIVGCQRPADNASSSRSTAERNAPADARAVLASLGLDVYPNAEPVDGLSVAVTEIPEGYAYITGWHTADPPPRVIAFYRDRLRNAVSNDREMKDMVVGETRSGDSVTVVTSPDARYTLITITVRKNRG